MSSFGQPTEHVFRPDDGQGKTARRAVDRGANHQPVRTEQRSAKTKILARIRHVLNDLHVQNDIELPTVACELLCRGVQILDIQAGDFRVPLGDRNIAGGGVHAGHLRAQPRHGFRKKSAAASDVQQIKPFVRAQRLGIRSEFRANLRIDVVQTARIEHVQWLELAVRVPPFFGHRVELGDFRRIGRLLGFH